MKKTILSIAALSLAIPLSQAKIATAQFEVTATVRYDCSDSKLAQMSAVPAYLAQCKAQEASDLKGATVTREGNTVSIHY